MGCPANLRGADTPRGVRDSQKSRRIGRSHRRAGNHLDPRGGSGGLGGVEGLAAPEADDHVGALVAGDLRDAGCFRLGRVATELDVDGFQGGGLQAGQDAFADEAFDARVPQQEGFRADLADVDAGFLQQVAALQINSRSGKGKVHLPASMVIPALRVNHGVAALILAQEIFAPQRTQSGQAAIEAAFSRYDTWNIVFNNRSCLVGEWCYSLAMSARQLCVVIAGPNGAGKTTFAREFLPKDARIVRFVNADLIAAGISPLRPEMAAVAAGRFFLSELERLAAARLDFAFETTLSGLGYLARLGRWKTLGYRIEIVYLRLAAPQLALRRIASRVQQGGHNVPRADVLRRFKRGWDNFQSHYRPMADSWAVYDNSMERPILLQKGENE